MWNKIEKNVSKINIVTPHNFRIWKYACLPNRNEAMKPSRLWAVSTREAQACTIQDKTNKDSAGIKKREEERER